MLSQQYSSYKRLYIALITVGAYNCRRYILARILLTQHLQPSQRNKCSSTLQGRLILGIAPLCTALYLDCTQLVSVSSSCVVWQKWGSVRSDENQKIR